MFNVNILTTYYIIYQDELFNYFIVTTWGMSGMVILPLWLTDTFLLELWTTAQQKIPQLKHVLSTRGVEWSIQSVDTPFWRCNFRSCSSHWESTTARINLNQHLQQLQDTPHYNNPPPISFQSKTTNPWIPKILLKNHISVIINVSFLLLINKNILCYS